MKIDALMLAKLRIEQANAVGGKVSIKAGNTLQSMIFLLPRCGRVNQYVGVLSDLVFSNPEFECDTEALQQELNKSFDVLQVATDMMDNALTKIETLAERYFDPELL